MGRSAGESLKKAKSAEKEKGYSGCARGGQVLHYRSVRLCLDTVPVSCVSASHALLQHAPCVFFSPFFLTFRRACITFMSKAREAKPPQHSALLRNGTGFVRSDSKIPARHHGKKHTAPDKTGKNSGFGFPEVGCLRARIRDQRGRDLPSAVRSRMYAPDARRSGIRLG